MDPELFWYCENEEDFDVGSIREPRASYSTDLAHNDLIAWKNAMDLAEVVYEVSRSWPRTEVYGLTNQTRRAAVSIPANIAEGQGRRGVREFLYHLSVALGSLRELETHLVLARRFGFLSEVEFQRVTKACLNTRKPLRGLINHLSKEGPDGN